jgi:hypothetical protein
LRLTLTVVPGLNPFRIAFTGEPTVPELLLRVILALIFNIEHNKCKLFVALFTLFVNAKTLDFNRNC